MGITPKLAAIGAFAGMVACVQQVHAMEAGEREAVVLRSPALDRFFETQGAAPADGSEPLARHSAAADPDFFAGKPKAGACITKDDIAAAIAAVDHKARGKLPAAPSARPPAEGRTLACAKAEDLMPLIEAAARRGHAPAATAPGPAKWQSARSAR